MSKAMMWCAVLMLGGCGATLQQLEARASLDLECAPAQLDVQTIDAATRRVEGCNRRALYVELFNDGHHPAWLLNSEVRELSRKQAGR